MPTIFNQLAESPVVQDAIGLLTKNGLYKRPVKDFMKEIFMNRNQNSPITERLEKSYLNALNNFSNYAPPIAITRGAFAVHPALGIAAYPISEAIRNYGNGDFTKGLVRLNYDSEGIPYEKLNYPNYE